MSKIGRKPILIPEGVKVALGDGNVLVSGPKGSQTVVVSAQTTVKISDDVLTVERKSDTKTAKACHGLIRSLIAGAIIGVTCGFEKSLEIIGVGYRAAVEDGILKLKVGYSHDVEISSPEGIEFEVKKNMIFVRGIDKQQVGQIAANIREVRKPEPYKGKGIKYVGEKILRKVGKAVKGSTGA